MGFFKQLFCQHEYVDAFASIPGRFTAKASVCERCGKPKEGSLEVSMLPHDRYFVDQEPERILGLNCDEGSYELHKRVFVQNLGVLLRQTGRQVYGCDLMPDGCVQVTYRSGTTRLICVRGNSYFDALAQVVHSMDPLNRGGVCEDGQAGSSHG